jgi:hypothetical protein
MGRCICGEGSGRCAPIGRDSLYNARRFIAILQLQPPFDRQTAPELRRPVVDAGDRERWRRAYQPRPFAGIRRRGVRPSGAGSSQAAGA